MSPLEPLFGFLGLLALASLAVKIWAFVDAVMRPQQAYVAADKQTKNLWLVLLGLAAGLTLLWGSGFIGLFSILGLIVALIYLLDVRPALRHVQGRGSSSSGPYGPW